MDNNDEPLLDASGATVEASPVASTETNEFPMDRATALSILMLNETANSYAIENRFWQLTKRYRLENDQEKLEQITCAYEVASGRAIEKKVEEAVYSSGNKFLGKTSRQWRVHFYYSWWKYVAVVLAIIIGVVIGRQIIFGGNYDVRVVSAGHFEMNNEYMDRLLKDDLGFQNPYITFANLIVDGSEPEETSTMYSAAAFAAYMSVNPDVIIFDGTTLPYYVATLTPLDDFYADLSNTLPPEVLAKIQPVISSRADNLRLTTAEDEIPEITAEDEVKHIYGIKIIDEQWIEALGFVNAWTYKRPSLAFTIPSAAPDPEKSKALIKSFLTNREIVMDRFNTANPTTGSSESY